MKDALENNLTSPAELPYFEGDFWPNVLEETIKELEQEEEEKRKREEAEAALAEVAEEQNSPGECVSGDVRREINSLTLFSIRINAIIIPLHFYYGTSMTATH